jgi:hypothetical protein
MLGYVSVEVWIGDKLSIWNPGLVKETAAWLVVTGLALLFRFHEASKQRHFYRKRIAAALGITEFLEFFTNLFVLSLLAELILQPFLVLIGMLSVIAATDRRYTSVKTLTAWILTLAGLMFVGFAIQQLTTRWDQVDKEALLLQFALPIWLTMGLLPFIYSLSLYSNYEKAFNGIDFATKNRSARFRAKLAFMMRFHLKSREAHKFSWLWARRLAEAASIRAARGVIDDFRVAERDKERAIVEEEERLRRYAGSDELDEEDRRLDRREFEETTDALRWLATCHMGWYRQGGRYRFDLLDQLNRDFTGQGLPTEAGIEMRVADDGQAWYAWRRTVSGWCFAIGAAGPPPDQWELDGPEPPTGFPGSDSAWGEGPFSSDTSRNW